MLKHSRVIHNMPKKENNKKENISIEKLEMISSIDEYSSRKKWEEVCWRKIIKSKRLLRLIIASRERHNLVMRAAIIKGLVFGRSYKQIEEELFVSPQTIRVVKKAIIENGYKSYLERSKKERKKKVYTTGGNKIKPKHLGEFRRTKYGKIYLPF